MGLNRLFMMRRANIISDDDFVAYIERSIVTLENSKIDAVGDNAFNSCSKLTKISLPDTAKIGYGAFISCSRLSDISVPNVISIGDNAFYKCTELSSVAFPKATNIGKRAFYYCSKLKTISLPSTIKIENDTFSGCNNLAEVHFSLNNKNTVENLSGYASKFGAVNAIIYFDL